MQERLSQNGDTFIVIRHLRDVNQYAVEYGKPERATELCPGPRFDTLDLAIAWVEKLEREQGGRSGG